LNFENFESLSSFLFFAIIAINGALKILAPTRIILLNINAAVKSLVSLKPPLETNKESAYYLTGVTIRPLKKAGKL
jgi:hypothetical protein